MTTRDTLIVFGSVHKVMRAETLAREAGFDIDTIPAPRSVSSECGVVLEIHGTDARQLEEIFESGQCPPKAVYHLRGDLWSPTTLAAAGNADSSTKLTRNTAYGGCGAKLEKGALEKILCGLPRLESEDLLVGIEYADDAGVVRVSPEIAIIHTTDFFPPMVDDPFSFGRIAAANALSDVYAMGGRPLAGMNLVSFPLAEHDRDVLKQILHGGLSALAEAEAVLAGGHTVEGAELLYGMAVTGVVHPDRIWRNGGARPGDALVLTKPLGTGLLTTAAKADSVEPTDLATAIRWMATLNRESAEVLAEIDAHAVTDVTGFGLAGHAAEMADASRLTIELDLTRLPVLDGALSAAETGFVPAGAAKNRHSIATAVHLAEDADPLLVDLAFDPQTSGGLLAAVPESDVAGLLRRLPGAACIGRCCEGPAGQVRLVE